MDYEKAYKAVLQTATQWIKDGCTDKEKICLECVFPELRESEDERIRKGLIEVISDIAGGWPFENHRITKKEAVAYLEKQKDASKAIEAVDRIDKYIDEHLANAHDMKDSNPDKKYYRGWDDALGKMAGILQDVYSDEKQKEQKPTDRFGEAREKYQVEWSGEDENTLENLHELITFGFTEKFFDAQTTVDIRKWLNTRLKSICPVRQEWSEEDEAAYDAFMCEVVNEKMNPTVEQIKWLRNIRDRLKSLRPSWKPSEEQMDRLFSIVAALRKDYCDDMADFLVLLYKQLKKLI